MNAFFNSQLNNNTLTCMVHRRKGHSFMTYKTSPKFGPPLPRIYKHPKLVLPYPSLDALDWHRYPLKMLFPEFSEELQQ